MTKQARVIVDTSGLYALVDRKDPHHLRAAAYLRQAAGVHSLLLSNHVFDETMTLAKMRLGMQTAVQLGLRLRNSQLIENIVFSAEEEFATWRLFTQYHDKEWSYTDCACLALAQRYNLDRAFTFDHHFSQMGLTPLP